MSTGTKWALALGTLAVALTGLGFGLQRWETAVHPKPRAELPAPGLVLRRYRLRHGLGPLRGVATVLAFVMDSEVIDGVVNACRGRLGRQRQGAAKSRKTATSAVTSSASASGSSSSSPT